jgi:hypothetical protein
LHNNTPYRPAALTTDTEDLIHCSMLFAAVPDQVRAMRLRACAVGPDLAVVLHAARAVQQGLAFMAPTIDQGRLRKTKRVAVLAVQMHLRDLVDVLSDPLTTPEEAEELTNSAQSPWLFASNHNIRPT